MNEKEQQSVISHSKQFSTQEVLDKRRRPMLLVFIGLGILFTLFAIWVGITMLRGYF